MITGFHVIAALSVARIRVSSERQAQDDIEEVLREAFGGAFVAREYRLDAGAIPDFLIDRRVVVEVKVKGANKRATYAQLLRYAGYDLVEEIVLATSLSMGLPPLIEDKPVFIASLGAAWL